MTDLESIYFEDLEENDFLKIQKFIKMPEKDVKEISPLWAIGENAHLALDTSIELEPEKYMIVYISPKLLIENTDRLILPTDRLFTGDLNDSRYASTLDLWSQGKPVDPPIISFQLNSKKSISISDGRHRSVLSYYLGIQNIPIIIRRADLENLKQFITIS